MLSCLQIHAWYQGGDLVAWRLGERGCMHKRHGYTNYPPACVRYDGVPLWNLRGQPLVHEAVWALNFVSFFFLYPSTFNLLEARTPLAWRPCLCGVNPCRGSKISHAGRGLLNSWSCSEPSEPIGAAAKACGSTQAQ